MSKTVCGAGKKVLASALSAAMVVAFAPAVAMAGVPGGGTASSEADTEVGQSEQSEGAVAQIGDQQYASLQDAVAAAKSGDSIKVLNDIVLQDTITIGDGKAITIDLGQNHSISRGEIPFKITHGKLTFAGQGTVYESENDRFGAVVVKGSTDESAVDYSELVVGENVTLRGWAGIFIDQNNSKCYGVKVELNGKAMNPGMDEHTAAGYGIYLNGTVTDPNNCPEVTVGKSAEIASKSAGVYAAGYGKWDLSGKITGVDTAVELRAGELVVNGGEYIATKNEFSCDPNGNGSTTSGAALAIAQHTTKKDIKVTINSGKFKGVKALNESNPQKNDPVPQVGLAINGGEFDGEIACEDTVDCITNGTFSDIAGAVKYAADGATLRMGADQDISAPIVVTKKVTLDANGKRLYNSEDIWSGNNWSLIEVANNGDLTIAGNGQFQAKENDCYSVDVCGGGKLTVESGTFVGNIHAVYVYEGSAFINGGAYSVQQTYSDENKKYGFVLNCYDQNRAEGKASIQVKGGSFEKFNPADCCAEGEHTNFVASGYVVSSNGSSYSVNQYVAPAAPVIPTPTPKPEPAPEPTPAAPGTAVSGTDSAGNKVDATVTDNTATTLPDGTTAAGSVEYKGSEATGSAAPTTEVSVPSTVTTSDGSTYVVTKIADSAFEGQEQLNKVTIPETVVEIGDKAFAGTSIEEVKIPAATTTIGAGVFKDCESLKTVDISASAITEVPADAFNGTALKAVEIPATVTTIGARAFKDTALKSVSTDAATVARSAFAGCESLKSASLPKVTEIGKYAFNGAAKLKSLATGKKLEVIGYKALAGTKIGTLIVSSKKLTKGSVKGSLKGSNVKKVVVDVSGSKKTVAKTVEKYKKFFTKKNCGKSVKVVAKKK